VFHFSYSALTYKFNVAKGHDIYFLYLPFEIKPRLLDGPLISFKFRDDVKLFSS